MSITSCGLGHGGQPLFRELYGTREAEHILSVSHATLYRLIATRRLDARKIGNKTLITANSIRQFLTDLPKAEVAA